MDRPTDPYAEAEAATRQWWRTLDLKAQVAFLVEIGIYDVQGNLTPEYDHKPEDFVREAAAK
jgi:hypothetical protein